MAMVKYNIYYRFINPNTQKGITNISNKSYKELKYLKDYSSRDESVLQATDITKENNPSNEKYNMIFYYNGSVTINDYLERKIVLNANTATPDTISVISDSFEQCQGTPWFLYGQRPSFEAALEMAKTLIAKVGIDNVKIAKEVPLKEYIDVE